MTTPRNALLHGTLDALVLKTLSAGPRHGYGIARWLEDATGQAVVVEEGSLYPALYRMERRGWIEADWAHQRAGPAREVLPAHAARPRAARGGDQRLGGVLARGVQGPAARLRFP